MTDILEALEGAWNEEHKTNLMHYCDLAAQEIRKLRAKSSPDPTEWRMRAAKSLEWWLDQEGADAVSAVETTDEHGTHDLRLDIADAIDALRATPLQDDAISQD